MGVSRLFRQNNGSAVVFLGIGIIPLLIALGLILAAPHSVLAAPCDPQVSGYGPTTSYIPLFILGPLHLRQGKDDAYNLVLP